MVNEFVYFFTPLFGILLVVLGIVFEDWVIGTFGGLSLFLYGVVIIINPISFFSTMENLLLASSCFGVGVYIILRGNIDKIEGILNY